MYEEIIAGNFSRRDVLRRSLQLGLSAPVIAGLLAACGGDDDDDDGASQDPTATSSDGGSQPTDTPQGADPTATPASEDPTATTANNQPTATTEETAPTATTEPSAAGGGGRLNIIAWQAATILNAHLAQGGKDTFAVRIYAEPLADFDPDGELVPILASEIPSLENGDVAADGTSVTWRLRRRRPLARWRAVHRR